MDKKELLEKVKQNLIIDFSYDDSLILSFIEASISYAEGFQHLDLDYYDKNEMTNSTKEAIIMLASFFYESRVGDNGGLFNQNSSSQNIWATVNNLLRLDKVWKV